MKVHPLHAFAAAAFALSACGSGSEPYSRIHDAALAQEGAAIVLLVEAGESQVRGSVFSGQRSYTTKRLALWRLSRADGSVSEWRQLEIPAGFEPFHARDARGHAGRGGHCA